MASKRNQRRKACDGKRRYATHEDALRDAVYLQRRDGFHMRAYRRALADTATALYLTRRQLQDAQKQLAEVPKCVRVLCRIVGRMMRGRG